ncbi:energy transducer TonB [Thalassotalea agarivorans]|uniref:TonB family C-terminal domain-containing protein n=1 Tax=Thalassotalea agarivorans TaxID=349064 RepID=A0A1I0BZU6_THASX|nr:energy transducer TonB [Thalassotalea agarivorans]SET12602.1 TonB family C-terminal domain-containing protein [Thalassotalea agarivorans]
MKQFWLAASSLLLMSCSASEPVEIKPREKVKITDVSSFDEVHLTRMFWLKKHTPNPVYPPAYELKGLRGCIDVQVLINSAGYPEKFNIRRSTVPADFEKATIAALQQWQWKPAPSNADYKPVLTSVQFEFSTKQHKGRSNKALTNYCVAKLRDTAAQKRASDEVFSH